jgi:UDP:flavonoid glycosyltransferase YjiC (YdhE family)
MLALAEAFVARGHDVAWLGQPSIERRAVAAGCRFTAFPGIPDYEARVPIEDQLSISIPVLVGAQLGEHLVTVAQQQHTDLVVVDANLAGAAAGAEALDRPSAVLLHSMFATFVDTWFADFWPLVQPGVNDMRRQFGLGACDSWADVFAGHDRIISVVPRRFDAAVRDRPRGMRNFGFLVPTTAARGGGVVVPEGQAPLVLVGLSTTYQHQDHLLQAILDALGHLDVRGIATTAGQVDGRELRCPPNVVVHEFVDHNAVLTDAEVMVTHAGLGSVAAALSQGVPLVCTPIGRDQHLNAQRVVSLGAGLQLDRDADPVRIADAVQTVLADRSFREAAGRIADESRRAGGQAAAVEDLEILLHP